MKNTAKQIAVAWLAGVSLLILSGCVSREVIVAHPGPPPGPVVVVHPPGAVWVPGHWAWRPYWGRYVWIRGHWR